MEMPVSSDLPDQAQTAELHASAGKFSVDLQVRMTSAGLLAVGGLVGLTLLGVAAVVWTATSIRRKHPFAAPLGRR